MYLCDMKMKKILHASVLVLVLSVIGMVSYYLIWILLDEEAWQMFQSSEAVSTGAILIDYLAFCVLTAVVSLFYWRSREKAERERDKFRLQALENQLSPHFVFNNFSILADLIEVDPKRASEYLMNLSKVYRYTLSHIDHDMVTLQEELAFLDRYLALQHQRFGDSIQVKIADDVAKQQGKLPPAALQMLIENAIKHNQHTQDRPLLIDVTYDGQRICVSNRKRPILEADSTSVGQRNIVERYRLLTSQKVRFSSTLDEYRVAIPLIPVEL